MRRLLIAAGGTVSDITGDIGGGAPDGEFEVRGLAAASIGDAAYVAGIAVHELAPRHASLEDAFMTLTHDAREYRTDRATSTPTTHTGTTDRAQVAA